MGLRVPQRILIVDDSAAMRRALRKRFEWQTGWEVCGDAACGQDGIAKAEYPIFVCALKASLQLKQELPNCRIKLRDAGDETAH